MKKIKVLVVDDSALIRTLVSTIVDAQSDMMVVAAAPDPLAARTLIKALDPDVITLDIEMPKMDGLDFLERIMRLRPMPVVMLSTLTERGSEATLRALELGAVDFIAKPKLDVARGMDSFGAELVEKIRTAATSRVRQIIGDGAGRLSRPVLPLLGPAHCAPERLIAIGASTGGTEAIKEVLVQIPGDAPPIVIAQHMPAGFTESFARRLDGLCRITVKEAQDGERLLIGHAYIAPGNRHLLVGKRGSDYIATLSDSDPVNRHRPSVEVLFHSVAKHVATHAIGIMLTGMGKDGASAMRAMKDAGACNFAQDEASCVVFGMPREAIAAGAIDAVLPLDEIARRVMSVLLRDANRTLNRV
jgi:two-component system chemotaxis response regulator CheB